jgi:transposase
MFHRSAIPKTRSASAHSCTARKSVERFFNEIKQRRLVATRYAKLAAIYLAFIKLASIRVWLHANESAPKSRCATQRKPRRQ